MLRPNMVIEYAKARLNLRRSDFDQLLNGINVGGRIVIGGDASAANKLRSVAQSQQRLGAVVAIGEVMDPQLDPFLTYSFDVTAIAQLIMVAKNENFHQTVDQLLGMIQKLTVEDGQKIEMTLQVIREQTDKIGHL